MLMPSHLSSCFHRVPFWRFLITGADQNRELKMWCTVSWTCLQTVRWAWSVAVVSHVAMQLALICLEVIHLERRSNCLPSLFKVSFSHVIVNASFHQCFFFFFCESSFHIPFRFIKSLLSYVLLNTRLLWTTTMMWMLQKFVFPFWCPSKVCMVAIRKYAPFYLHWIYQIEPWWASPVMFLVFQWGISDFLQIYSVPWASLLAWRPAWISQPSTWFWVMFRER